MPNNHLLYSYRRCPYAMRARMALVSAGIQCDVHEVDFKDKRNHLLEISPKGTVPVLQTTEGRVIDESLNIMLWALEQSDARGLLACDISKAKPLIAENDGAFKNALDRYKYPNRFEGEDCTDARENGLTFLQKLETALSQNEQLLGDNVSIADIAIFPFIRQFLNVDKAWFDNQALPKLHGWLEAHLNSALFKDIIQKQKMTPYALL